MDHMRRSCWLTILLLALVCGPARSAAAQTKHTWLNLGVGATTFQSTDADHSDNFGVGIAWRLGRSKTGWSPSIGFSWYETGLRTAVAGRTTQVGSIHVRPIMFGYGYTWRRNRTAISANAVGGYSFNSISINNALRQAYLQDFNTWVAGNIANSWVAKPALNFWYDLAPRFGLNLSLGYLLNRPTVILTTPAGRTRQRWNADMVTLSFGVVYGIL
jgi:hypothetical protein